MKTEIDNLIKALEAFKAKLADQEQPVVEEDWVYLDDPTHVLRKRVDWCKFVGDEDWYRVDGLSGKTIEYSRKVGSDSFRCLRKDSPYPCHHEPEVKQEEPADPEKDLLAKAQDNAGDGVEVDSYHRLGWYRMACGGIARIKRTHSKYILGDATESGTTFDCTMWDAGTGEHITNSDWNLTRWKGIEQ